MHQYSPFERIWQLCRVWREGEDMQNGAMIGEKETEENMWKQEIRHEMRREANTRQKGQRRWAVTEFWAWVSFDLVAWSAAGEGEGCCGEGGGGGVDLMMWCYGPSPSKGGLWKALLITTCDETGRTKTAGQKITAWELWVNLKYNKRAHTPRLHLLLLPRSIHKHTHTHRVRN